MASSPLERPVTSLVQLDQLIRFHDDNLFRKCIWWLTLCIHHRAPNSFNCHIDYVNGSKICHVYTPMFIIFVKRLATHPVIAIRRCSNPSSLHSYARSTMILLIARLLSSLILITHRIVRNKTDFLEDKKCRQMLTACHTIIA